MLEFDPRDTYVALLAGGKSGEREISLASGEGAKSALVQAGFKVETIDPSVKSDLKRLMDEPFDVAFLCLHGSPGEDGTVQGFLETIGLPYTASGVWASALAMDKVKSKLFYEQAGLKTPPSKLLARGTDVDGAALIDEMGERCVVKPTSAGSALGVFIVESADEMERAVEEVFALEGDALVERYVQGVELTVAVLGDADAEALPVIEIIPTNEFYDFESKYAPGGSKHICPARIDDETTSRVQGYALAAHRTLGCEGVSRSDFILDDEGECWILETNTIPGMTETSLLPDAARVAGMTFSQLCTRLVELALRRGTKG